MKLNIIVLCSYFWSTLSRRRPLVRRRYMLPETVGGAMAGGQWASTRQWTSLDASIRIWSTWHLHHIFSSQLRRPVEFRGSWDASYLRTTCFRGQKARKMLRFWTQISGIRIIDFCKKWPFPGIRPSELLVHFPRSSFNARLSFETFLQASLFSNFFFYRLRRTKNNQF